MKAIAEHWTELLEPEPVPRAREATPAAPSPPRQTAQERRAAEWQERTRRELEKQLAAFDDWSATRTGAMPITLARGGMA